VVDELERKSGVKRLMAVSFSLVVLLAVSVVLVSTARAAAGESETSAIGDPGAVKWAFIAAAISTAVGCLGAGVAVAYVGAAAVGAVGEKPEVAGRTLIFVGLAEGIAIYGLIIAIMILAKV
jgi:V/A-type H+-transporting ATPase subunit K